MSELVAVTLERITDCMESLGKLSGTASDEMAQTFREWRLNPPDEAVRDQIADPTRSVVDLAKELANSLLLAVSYLANAAKLADDASTPGMPDEAVLLLGLNAAHLIASAEFWHGSAWVLRKQGYRVAVAEVRAVAKHLTERNRNAATKGHSRDQKANVDALRLYAQRTGQPGYRSKNEAAATIARIVHMSRHTVRRWLIKA